MENTEELKMVERAENALIKYSIEKEGHILVYDAPEAILTNLLDDLMTYCAQRNVDFGKCLRLARERV
ncbi:MAG TPA: hypothetical protein VE957_04610 [Terriglobales bacterium]|nr:hypothetical protein [Terriglobales bacterium]